MAGPGNVVLLDGYNVIHRHPQWGALPLERARAQLIQAARAARWPFPVRQVVIAFDGPENSVGPIVGHVRVEFAWPSADACLQARLRAADAPEQLVLISDDREILRTARSQGADSHSAQWFLDLTGPRRAAPSASGHRAGDADRSIDPDAVRAINDEFRRRWLSQAQHPPSPGTPRKGSRKPPRA